MGFGELLAQGFLGAIGGAGESVKEQSAAEAENKRKIKLLEQALNYKMAPSEIAKENAMARYYDAMAKHAGMGGVGSGGFDLKDISSFLYYLSKMNEGDKNKNPLNLGGGAQPTQQQTSGYVNPYSARYPTR